MDSYEKALQNLKKEATKISKLIGCHLWLKIPYQTSSHKRWHRMSMQCNTTLPLGRSIMHLISSKLRELHQEIQWASSKEVDPRALKVFLKCHRSRFHSKYRQMEQTSIKISLTIISSILELALFGWPNGLTIQLSMVLAIYFQTNLLEFSSMTRQR